MCCVCMCVGCSEKEDEGGEGGWWLIFVGFTLVALSKLCFLEVGSVGPCENLTTHLKLLPFLNNRLFSFFTQIIME